MTIITKITKTMITPIIIITTAITKDAGTIIRVTIIVNTTTIITTHNHHEY